MSTQRSFNSRPRDGQSRSTDNRAGGYRTERRFESKSFGRSPRPQGRPQRRFESSDRNSSPRPPRPAHQHRFGRERFRSSRRPQKNFREHMDASRFIQKAERIEDKVVYTPTHKFSDFNIDAQLKKNILDKGFDTPTPIQDQAIPEVLKGRDVLGIANTGTGKTAAFLIPLIEKVIQDRDEQIIILAPTRELAEQIEAELRTLTRTLSIFSVLCIGGESIFRQMKQLHRKYNFIIGTPGRIKDLSKRAKLDIGSFETIVLDEVDRMLDMGFVDEIKELIAQLPEDKHSLFFSATVNRRVDDLIKLILKKDYVKVSITPNTTSKNIEQDVVYFTDYEDKLAKLEELLKSEKFEKYLIFANTKREVETIDNMLYKKGYKVDAIHGDKKQSQRKRAVDKFKKAVVDILVATDVAARGLDINNVSLVINYDIPNTHDDYIHRIGRTGRANQAGHALTFVRKRY